MHTIQPQLVVPLVFLVCMCHSLPLVQENDRFKPIVSVFHVITTGLDRLKTLLGMENHLNTKNFDNGISVPIQIVDTHQIMKIHKNVASANKTIVTAENTTQKSNFYTTKYLPTRTWFNTRTTSSDPSTTQAAAPHHNKTGDIPLTTPIKRNIIPSTMSFFTSPTKLNLLLNYSDAVPTTETQAVTSDQNTAFVHALTALGFMDITPKGIGFLLPLTDSTIPQSSDYMVKTTQGLSGLYSLTSKPTTIPVKTTTEPSNINIKSNVTKEMFGLEPAYDVHEDKKKTDEITNKEIWESYVTTQQSIYPSKITNSTWTMMPKISIPTESETPTEQLIFYDKFENNLSSVKSSTEVVNVKNDESKIKSTTSNDLSKTDQSISENGDISTGNIGYSMTSTQISITDPSQVIQKEGSNERENQDENNHTSVIDDIEMKEQDSIMSIRLDIPREKVVSTPPTTQTTVTEKMMELILNGINVRVTETPKLTTTVGNVKNEIEINGDVENDSKPNINSGNIYTADEELGHLFDDVLHQIEQMDSGNEEGEADNGETFPKNMKVSSIEKNVNATDTKSFLFDLFGISKDSSTETSSTSEIFSITLQKSEEETDSENDCEGENIHHEAYAVIPTDDSPAIVTLLWDAKQCEGAIPSNVKVEVVGTSLDHTAKIYLLRGEHKCGAFAAVPKDAWLLATVEYKNNAGTTLASWPSLTLTKLQGSHVIVENLNTGKLTCATLH